MSQSTAANAHKSAGLKKHTVFMWPGVQQQLEQ